MSAGWAVVPTIGASPRLAEALAALRTQEGVDLRVLCVGPAEVLAGADFREVSRLEVPVGTGFAAASNRGLREVFRETENEWVALVNDDAIPAPDWAAILVGALARHPEVGAVQGLNLDGTGERVDGAGIRWNRWWQAVQGSRGREVEAVGGLASGPVAGASATGVVLRRRALEALGSDDGEQVGPRGAVGPLGGAGLFDEVLESWYEDVDLAARLAAAGWASWLEPSARLRHVGGASGQTLGRRRWELLYGNRWLVLARHLGRAFPRQVPRILARDVLDRLAAVRRGDRTRAAGIRAGWSRARRLLPGYRHRGAPTLRRSAAGGGG